MYRWNAKSSPFWRLVCITVWILNILLLYREWANLGRQDTYMGILQYLYKGSILHFTLDVFSSQIHPGQGLCYAIGQLFFIWIFKLASNVTYIISNLVLLQHQLEKLFGIGSYSDKDLKKLANVTDTLR